MSKLIVGAPSLTGVDANKAALDAFANVVFPTLIRFENLTGRGQSYPEINGLFLIGHESIDVMVDSLDALRRVSSSIESVADLHQFEQFMAISLPEEVVDEVSEDELDDDSTGDEGEGDSAQAVAFLNQVLEGLHDEAEDLDEQIDQAATLIEADPNLRKKTLIANARKHAEKVAKQSEQG